jgi:hypothetical protein
LSVAYKNVVDAQRSSIEQTTLGSEQQRLAKDKLYNICGDVLVGAIVRWGLVCGNDRRDARMATIVRVGAVEGRSCSLA